MSDIEVRSFEAQLYELPSNYEHIKNVALDVPPEVSGALGRRGHVPVIGSADGAELVATLVPIGGGRHRLFLNQELRRAIGKGAGDRVEIRIGLDTSDRMPAMPEDLQAALRAAGALDAWGSLSPSHRREHLRYLADAKRAPTRANRIARIAEAAGARGRSTGTGRGSAG